ncbi:MAG: hypothetical protein JXA10_18290 [Anaerolineae bacterium]|nr:hypothetical protein [Anaerolineae bacterium]
MARSQRAVPAEKQADFMAALAEAYFRRGTKKLMSNPAGAHLALPEFAPIPEIDPALLRGTELMLARANTILEQTDEPALQDAIADVVTQLEIGAEDLLRSALDALTDALFDLDDEE